MSVHRAPRIVVSARARAMRITVYPDGDIKVTVPRRISRAALDQFIRRSKPWMERQCARFSGRVVLEAKKALIPEYKRAAEALARTCAHKHAARYGVQFRAIAIRAQKSRWGSCSRAGNLSFNYKIALLPRELAEYIVVHEICHLLVFDHSRDFWRAVERTVPNHRALRKTLTHLCFRFS